MEMLQALKNFVHQRLKVLEDQIDEYKDGAVVINVLNTLNKLNRDNYVPPGMHYMLFPEKLVDKMEQCISDEDLKYIFTKLATIKDEEI